MDIRTLQYFLTIAREESITKAAKVLNMTQPPLSRQMKELENEIGKQLFIRGSKKVTLTDDGLLLKRRAEELVSLLDKTLNELTSSDEHITGDILIGAGETKGISFLADIAESLNKKYPEIHYKLYSGDAEFVKERLDNGLIDFGLFIGNVDIEKYEYVKLPISERWGIIMKNDSPLAKFDHISPEMLKDLPLILSHQAARGSEMSMWLRNSNSNPDIMLTYNLAYNASLFVKNGFGYMLALDNIVDTTPESGLTFRPLLPSLHAEMYLVWKKNQVFGKAAKAFLDELNKSIVNI